MVIDENQIVKLLSPTKNIRHTLYLAPLKVESYYIQKVAQAQEFIRKKELTGTTKLGLQDILGGEIAGMEGIEERVAMKPMLQALVAEKAARVTNSLIDLATRTPIPGELLFYVGTARFTSWDERVNPAKTGFSSEVCQRITEVRKTQEKVIRYNDEKLGTVVLTFVRNFQVYAAIASTEFMKDHISSYSSYFTYNHFGILCTLEGMHDSDITFLDPLWIWYETY